MKTLTATALKFILVMTILTGIIYPFFITGVAQLTFPAKANGSLIRKDGNVIGSGLIGQNFDRSIYFVSRPSAISYNPVPSGASNLGPTSNKLRIQVSERRNSFMTNNSITDSTAVPREMIFASGSGLDPHISPKSALLQVDRIAKARKFDDNQKQRLLLIIEKLSEKPQFRCLGENRINVLILNLELNNIDVTTDKNN